MTEKKKPLQRTFVLFYILITDRLLEKSLTRHPADAGAMPRMACVLVNGKGFGDPRQRG